MPFADVNGARLNYIQVEPDHKGPVEDLVMVHGLATNLAFWYMRYAEAFTSRFRVTFFDLRGHGYSEVTSSGYSPSSLSRDLEGLLDHLNIPRAHILAHSFGGVVALGLARLQPARIASLVLADTQISAGRSALAGKSWEHGNTVAAAMANAGIELDTRDPYFGYHLLTAVSELVSSGQTPSDELLEFVGPLLGRFGRRTAKRWLTLVNDTRAKEELVLDDGLTPEALRSSIFPALALFGDRSQAYVSRSVLASLLPRVEVQSLEHAGHFFPATRPDELIAACQEFWNGVSTPSGRYPCFDALPPPSTQRPSTQRPPTIQ